MTPLLLFHKCGCVKKSYAMRNRHCLYDLPGKSELDERLAVDAQLPTVPGAHGNR